MDQSGLYGIFEVIFMVIVIFGFCDIQLSPGTILV